jgi:hypothetical protein
MATIVRSGVHMLQVAAMVGVGFGFLALLEGDYAKKFASLISRRILARLQRKVTARSEV